MVMVFTLVHNWGGRRRWCGSSHIDGNGLDLEIDRSEDPALVDWASNGTNSHGQSKKDSGPHLEEYGRERLESC